jgi:hypothetical protein
MKRFHARWGMHTIGQEVVLARLAARGCRRFRGRRDSVAQLILIGMRVDRDRSTCQGSAWAPCCRIPRIAALPRGPGECRIARSVPTNGYCGRDIIVTPIDYRPRSWSKNPASCSKLLNPLMSIGGRPYFGRRPLVEPTAIATLDAANTRAKGVMIGFLNKKIGNWTVGGYLFWPSILASVRHFAGSQWRYKPKMSALSTAKTPRFDLKWPRSSVDRAVVS